MSLFKFAALSDCEFVNLNNSVNDWIEATTYSDLTEVDYVWVLMATMLTMITRARTWDPTNKPLHRLGWLRMLDEEFFPMAWIGMINHMYYGITSYVLQPNLVEPDPSSIGIPSSINFTPDHFKPLIIDLCKRHFTMSDIDPATSLYSEALRRQREIHNALTPRVTDVVPSTPANLSPASSPFLGPEASDTAANASPTSSLGHGSDSSTPPEAMISNAVSEAPSTTVTTPDVPESDLDAAEGISTVGPAEKDGKVGDEEGTGSMEELVDISASKSEHSEEGSEGNSVASA